MRTKETGNPRVLSKIWIIILYFLGVGVQLLLNKTKTTNGSNLPDNIITYVFFAVIALIFSFAISRTIRGVKFTRELHAVTTKIRETAAGSPSKLLDDNPFTDGFLKNAFDRYHEDIKRIKIAAPEATLDIEEYINHDLLEARISIYYLNLIPGFMTGLGILGTFVGLSIGLSNFNFTGSDIASEIQPLMDGIKVAFHTSIIGLVYSLIFNLVYRKQLDYEKDIVDDFLAAFRKYVVPVSDDGNAETYFKYFQKEVTLLEKQYDTQTNISESQRLMVESQAKQYELTERLGKENNEKITSSLNEIIVPEIQNMAMILESFAKTISRNQAEELQKVVDLFILQMNSTLGDSFAEFGKMITATNESQKKSIEETQNILNKIGTMAIDLAQINKSIECSVEKVETLSKKTIEMQDALNNNITTLNAQAEKTTKLTQDAGKAIESLSTEHQKMIALSDEFIVNAQKLSDEIVDTCSTALGKANAEIIAIQVVANETASTIKETSAEAVSTIAVASTDAADKLAGMYNSTAARINEMTELLGKEVTESIGNIAKTSAENGETLAKSTEKCLNSVLELCRENREHLMKSFNDLETLVDKKLQQIQSIDTSVAGEISGAAMEMRKASSELNDRMIGQINNALKAFDDNLAKAARHLSGTILEIEKATNNVPAVVAKTFAQMQEELDQYLEYADKLHRNLEEKWAQLERENRG